MTAIFAWPAQLKWRDPGLALTVVVPATACNLACGFCAIRQRREAETSVLAPEDYVRFIHDAVIAQPTAIISIQGYEPLLDEAWPYTQRIMATARDLSVPRSLVTNGVNLQARAKELADLDPTGVTVSLDSADPVQHDRIRGKVGAFEATLRGLRSLAAIGDHASRLTVSSVLLPRRRTFLSAMPALLANLSVRQWAVSPLLKVVRDGVGGPVALSQEITDDVLWLYERAATEGVELVLDDELDCLQSRREGYQAFTIRRFDRPDGLVRLAPSGACSVGRDILRQIDDTADVWCPSEDSATFLSRIRKAAKSRWAEAA